MLPQISFCFSRYRIWDQTRKAVNSLNLNLKFLICFLNPSFISSLGVSYMMLCTDNYPSVLAFCFLDELQKEFITTYNMMKTNTAIRPYCFIEFGKDLTFFPFILILRQMSIWVGATQCTHKKMSKAVYSSVSGGFRILFNSC